MRAQAGDALIGHWAEEGVIPMSIAPVLFRVMEKVAPATTMGTVKSPIRLVLVDDELHVRRGLAMAFSAESDLEVIGEAGDGRDGVAIAHELRPDVVVMDVRMRPVDGLTATRLLQESDPDIRVVVLSLLDDALTRAAATEAGARAFVGKQEGSERLVSTIRAVAAAC
jgi:DNA-binding NarL/FixJ family response regulator